MWNHTACFPTLSLKYLSQSCMTWVHLACLFTCEDYKAGGNMFVTCNLSLSKFTTKHGTLPKCCNHLSRRGTQLLSQTSQMSVHYQRNVVFGCTGSHTPQLLHSIPLHESSFWQLCPSSVSCSDRGMHTIQNRSTCLRQTYIWLANKLISCIKSKARCGGWIVDSNQVKLPVVTGFA